MKKTQAYLHSFISSAGMTTNGNGGINGEEFNTLMSYIVDTLYWQYSNFVIVTPNGFVYAISQGVWSAPRSYSYPPGFFISNPGPGSLILYMPGTYNFQNFNALQLYPGVDHLLWNAKIECAWSQGCFTLTSDKPGTGKVNIIGIGNSSINSIDMGDNYGAISPHSPGNIEFRNLKILSSKQLISAVGSLNTSSYLTFKNCTLISADNPISPISSTGYMGGKKMHVRMIDCYFAGQLMLRCGEDTTSDDKYQLYANNCFFQNNINSNGIHSNIAISSFDNNPDLAPVMFLENCKFISHVENISLHSSGGFGENSRAIIHDCMFVNGSEGSIINNQPIEWFLYGNITKNAPTGDLLLNEYLSIGSDGMIAVPELELILPIPK